MKTQTNNKLNNINLQKRIEDLHDHLYANSNIRNTATIATEVLKILHVAIYVEKKENKIPAYNYNNIELNSIIKSDEYFCNKIAEEVIEKYAIMNAKWGIYEENSNILLDNKSIAYTTSAFSNIIVSDQNRDILGDTIESIRAQWVKSVGGQFFTDQRVTELAISLLDFKPDKDEDLVDLCSGTGGFLLAGIRKIKTELEKKINGNSIEVKLKNLTEKKIKGIEIDSEIAEIANGTISALLGTKLKRVVKNDDSLKIDPLGLDSEIKYDSHYCAATNPPFGVKISIKDRNILKSFELASLSNNSLEGNKKTVPLATRSLDILFLEQNLKILKPGKGRLAIVLPYQIVSGPQTKYIRDWLIKNARIMAVIDLPSETFQPHTGTKTVLLIVEKRIKALKNISDAKNEIIFMGLPKWIGHDRRGRTVFKKDHFGKNTEEVLTDFPELEEYYIEYKKQGELIENEICFTVKIEKIINDSLLRLNALYYKPTKEDYILKNGDSKAWEKKKVKDVVQRIFYPGRFKRNYIENGFEAIPFLGGTSISQLYLINNKWLSKNDQKLEELKVEEGWILVTRSGSTGIISTVPKSWEGYAVSEHVIRIIPNEEMLPGEYISLFLRTKYGQRLLSQGIFGSVIDEITPEFIGELEIPIPKKKTKLNEIKNIIREIEENRNCAIDKMTQAIHQLESEIG